VSGRQLARALCKHWDYVEVHQTGSHIILDTAIPSRQRVVVPAHKSLRLGTFNAILRCVAGHKGVTREAIVATL